jgi:hypothetical protein
MSSALRNLLGRRGEQALEQVPREPGVIVDEVLDVRGGTPQRPSHATLGRPPGGAQLAGFALPLVGWIFDRDSKVVAIEMIDRGEVLGRVPVELKRDDVAAAFPDEVHAAVSGFSGVLGAIDLPQKFDLSLEAIGEDDGRSPVWRLRGRRASLRGPSAPKPRMHPMVLNGLGRSGTTWLMWLLAHHPEIVVYRPFRREPRLAGYWIEVLRNIAKPRSHLGALAPRLNGSQWWLGEADPGPLSAEDSEFEHSVGTGMLQELAAFGRGQTEAAYSALARQEGKHEAKWFAEKAFGYAGARAARTRLYDEIYPDAREVLIVRDLRDVVTSMAAYDEQRGFKAFGRDSASDERGMLRGVSDSALYMLERHRVLGRASSLVRYEELIREPRRVLAQVFEHLNVDASPQLVADVLGRASQETESMQHHRTAPDAEASIGRWRRDMSAEQAQLVTEVLAGALEAYGYEVEGDRVPPNRPPDA